MKKWLSLVVMTCLLLGATYFAVATEAGRNVLNSTAATRAMLAEIDALLAKDATNPELLAKRQEVVEVLQSAGETVVDVNSEVKDIEYLRSIGAYADIEAIEQEQEANRAAYLEAQYERLLNESPLSESEKLELLHAGYFDDSRFVRDGLDDTGGPDGAGYRFVDNLNGDTATFAWIELCGDSLATELLTSDDNFLTINWGWNFPFYGGSYSTGYVSSNGQLRFVTGSSLLTNADISATNTTPWISGFWDDLDPDGGGPAGSGCGGAGDNEVRWRDFGDKVVVSWTNTPHFSESTDRYNFQIIIFPDGKVKLQYNTNWVNGTTGSTSSSIHIDGPLTDGVSYLFNGAPANRVIDNTGRAIWFYQLFLDDDFACSAVLQPTPLRVSPGAALNIVGRFRNAGTNAQSSPVSYQFNGGAIVTEATAILSTNQSEDHDFAGTETAPMAVGDYTLTLWSDLAVDEDRTNDTMRVTVLVRECFDEAAPNDGFSDAGTTCGALNDWSATCLGSADASEDYIYQWTTTANGAWNLQLIASTAQTRGLVVSTACPPDSFNCVAFANIFQDTVSLNCVPLAAGTYYIMVDRSTGCDAYTLNVTPCTDVGRCCYNGGANCADNGAFECQQLAGNWDRTTTCAASPCPTFLDGGNDCATAVALTIPATVRGNTVGAGDNDPGAQCALGSTDPYEGFNTAPDEWYTITGTGDSITVSLCSGYTAYDTQIAVFCSDDCANFTCVAGNDDATCTFSGLRSTARFCSELGRTYYVVVDGWGAGSGNFELIITLGAPCTTPVDCAPEGRCCYLDNGAPACVDNLAAECAALNGQWNDAASCATIPCPVGRCCYVENGVGTCETNTQLECNALGGTWNGTLTCESTPCPVARCCYDDNGTTACVNEIVEVCNTLGGLWSSGLTCESAACPTVLQGSDLCADAVMLPALNATYTGTTAGSTAETGIPTCGSLYNSTSIGVWYKLIGTGNTITIGLCDPITTWDTELFVFCNTCDTLLCVGGDDDFCADPALASQLSFCSVAGAEYLVLVTAFSAGSGPYAMTVSDDGVTCVPVVQCPVLTVPCDPVVDLAVYVVTVGGLADHLQIHFTAPQDATYKIWTTANPNNDGNPDDGADGDWTLLATLPNLLAGPQVFDAPAGFPLNYANAVVTADCTPAP